MEFLKTCNANAQAIGDFEAVAYQAFSVRRNLATPSATPNDRNPSEDLRAVEATFRQDQQLVVQDVSKPWLWLFRATTVDKVGEKPQDISAPEGYQLQREQFGVMKASELARPPIRTTNMNTPSSATTSSPSTAGPLKGLQGGGGGVRLSEQQQPHDSFVIYELFTSSVVGLISYYVVKHHNAVALNYRSLLSKPLVHQTSNRDETDDLDLPYFLTNIGVYWASSGTLLISTFSTTKPDIHCLSEVFTANAQKKLVGSCVRIAPNGSLAQIVSFDDVAGPTTDDTNPKQQRKRAKVGTWEQGIERWKSVVARWLSWKGYLTTDLERRTSWIRLRIAQAPQPTGASPSPWKQPREVLWPKALCFFYTNAAGAGADPETSTQSATPQKDNSLAWFATSQATGFRDPVDVAQQWFVGKPERDKIVEARRKALKAEEEAARPKEEVSGGLLPSSPLNSRIGAYGDLQAVSGVYPTPPDGVAPGTAVSSGDTPNVSGTMAGTVLMAGGHNPAINLSAPQDSLHPDEQQRPPTSPEFSVPFDDNFNTSGGNDDLFESMDEDTFNGDGVTDADFNFFDEPDGDDIDMLDIPVAQAIPPPTTKPMKKETEPSPSIMDIKEEGSDPMAALEDALATASAPPVEHTMDTKMEEDVDVELPPAQPIQESDNKLRSAPKSEPVHLSAKETTPPLSPRHIQARLLPSPKDKPSIRSPERHLADRHRDSVFDAVSFNRQMSLSDAKYHDGRFSSQHGKQEKESSDQKAIPKRPTSLRDLPLVARLRYAIGVAATNGIPEMKSTPRADGDSSDSLSEPSSADENEVDDVASLPSEPPSAGLIFPGKRKLPTEGNATPLSATSFADSLGGEALESPALHTDEGSLITFEPTPWDWSMVNIAPPAALQSVSTRYSVPVFSPTFTSMPNTPTSQLDLSFEFSEEKPLSSNDSIAIAQVVTEQIVSTTLDVLHEGSPPDPRLLDYTSSDSRYQALVKTLFPKATDCDLPALVSVADVFPELPHQAKGQQRPPPRRPNEGPALPGHHMFQINPSHVRVRRADALWDLLPPALAFWESLGLYPCSPVKNVGALCIYPHSDTLQPCLEHFLINLQIAYEGCKLGAHERMETVPDFEGGLVPCKIKAPASSRVAFKALRETCVTLGKALASKHAQMREGDDGQKIDAFVIYMIDPFENASAIWELCSAFWSLFQAYGQGPPNRPEHVPKPDLVLQVVPIKYIASFDVPVILDASVYTSLAREVYDRCPPSAPSEDKTPLSIYAAPSFQLEESIPRGIPFKLNAEPPQDLLRENSYMHLGYAISLDGSWITAAWTDSCGKSRAVVSYNLGTRPFTEIAREIWQTTIEMLQARRVMWRVCVAKAGVIERDEFEAWVLLTTSPTQVNLLVYLMTVDTNPPLKFTPTMPLTTIPQTTNIHPSANTPGSTPQAGVSPDPHSLTPAATPSADSTVDPSTDPDARIVDVTDESWGIILSHRLHNTNSTVEFRPSLISGLLVKRGLTHTTSTALPSPPTPDPERGPIIVGVNIIWVGYVNYSRPPSSTPSTTSTPSSPFPSTAATEGISPGGVGPGGMPGGVPMAETPMRGERTGSSLMWTPTPQTRATAENLLKEVLGQYRGLGTLARLRGVRGSRMGCVPWHVAVAKRGVEALVRIVPN